MNKTALVTGASGFIGSTLVERLVARGYQVRALVRPTSNLHFLQNVPFEKVIGSLQDKKSLLAAVQGVDVVFHLAGTIFSRDSQGFFRDNAEGTHCLAQAIVESKSSIQRFVYVSSVAASGPSSSLLLKDENDPDAPVSFYGKSKLEAERILLSHQERFPIVILRPGLVYGPRDKGILFPVRMVSKKWVPIVRGRNLSGEKYFSFIHCEDLCQVMIQAGEASLSEVPSGEKFYVCGDGVYTNSEMVRWIGKQVGVDPYCIAMPMLGFKFFAFVLDCISRISGTPFPLTMDKYREIAQDYWVFSNRKAKKLLGFQPQYEAFKGLAETIRWYQQQQWI